MPIPPVEYMQLLAQAAIFTTLALVAVTIAMWRGCFADGILANAPAHRTKLRLPDIAVVFVLAQLGMGLAAEVFMKGLDEDSDPIKVASTSLTVQIIGYVLPLIYLYVRLTFPQFDKMLGTPATPAAPDTSETVDVSYTPATSDTPAPSQAGPLARFGLGVLTISQLKSAIGGLLLAMPVVLAASSLAVLVTVLLDIKPPASGHQLLSLLSRTDQTSQLLALLAGSAVIVAPIVEEIIYRGVVHSALQRVISNKKRWLVLLLSSTFFSLIHLGGVPVEMLPALFLLGVILGWLYETTGSLWPCMLVHALFNTINIALATIAT